MIKKVEYVCARKFTAVVINQLYKLLVEKTLINTKHLYFSYEFKILLILLYPILRLNFLRG